MGLDIFSYAVLKNTIKNSEGGWPSDLPKPSKGGYGYTTEVTNEVELTCKRPEVEHCWANTVEVLDGLIVGENYEVTVNGVTGTYECFEYDGMPTLGYPYEFESYEPNKWVIYGDTFFIDVGMNLRLGETATIVISSMEFILEGDYQEVYASWSGDVESPDGLIVGESYEVTVNGVTGTYECFEDDEGDPALGYPYEIMEQYEHGVWQIYSYEEDDITYVDAGMNLRPGETATFVIKLVAHDDHRIDAKYLPEGGVGWTETVKTPLVCETVDDIYPLRLGDYFRSNDGENPYKYPFEITAVSVEYDDVKKTQLYLYSTNDHWTTQQLVIKDQYGNIFMDEPVVNWDEYPIDVDGKLLQPGEHYTVILDSVEYSYAEEEVVHKIDPKYVGSSCDETRIVIYLDETVPFGGEVQLLSGSYEEVKNAILNGAPVTACFTNYFYGSSGTGIKQYHSCLITSWDLNPDSDSDIEMDFLNYDGSWRGSIYLKADNTIEFGRW